MPAAPTGWLRRWWAGDRAPPRCHTTTPGSAVQVSSAKDGRNSADLFRTAKEMTGRDPLVTRSDLLEAIGSRHEGMFGHNPCSILVQDAPIRN